MQAPTTIPGIAAGLRQLFDRAPALVVLLSGPEHTFAYVNPAYRCLLDPETERDMTGMRVAEAVPELVEQGFTRQLDEVYATGQPFSGEGVLVRLAAEGGALRDFYFDFVYQPVLGADGKVIGVFGHGADVTQRVMAEHALREREATLALATRASGLGVWTWDLRTDEVYFSPRAREIWGFPEQGAVTQEMMTAALHPEDQPETQSRFRRAIDPAVRDTSAYLYRVITKDGVRWVRAFAEAVFEDDGRGARAVTYTGTMEDITEAKATLAALQASQARLQLALDAGRMAVWAVDANGQVHSSPELNRLLGLDPDSRPTLEELQARYYPGELERLQGLAAEAVARGDRYVEFEYRHLWPNDEVRWLLVRAEFQQDENGAPAGSLGVALDITDRKRDEEARERMQTELEDTVSRLRIAQRAGRIGTFELFPNEGRILVSPEFCRLWGVEDKREYRTRELLDLILPEDLKAIATGGREIDNETLRYIEYRIRKADTGEMRWMARRGEVVEDEKGRKRYLGVSYDITDRKRAELKLQALNETLEAQVAERTAERDRMWRLSAELMLVADFEATIVAVNPAWRDALGYEADELEGTKFLDLVHPDDVEPTLREVGRLAEGATTFAFENRYRHKDGSYRNLAWTAVPDAAFIHAVARDVTQEREAALALKRTEEALRQSQKMEAVGQLTGGIAHDFNNMLAIVIGSLDLARRRLDRGQAGAERHLDNALEGAQRAATLTQRLLAFSRQQPLSPRVLNLNRLVGDMSELLRRTLSERIELETVLAGGLWSINADPHQLESAIVNLAVNARDAMPDGGQLTIETANTHLDEAYVREHLGLNPGQYVMIAVSDRGAGMSAEVLNRVFDPFFTTKPVGKGTGLGLSMVYGFVKQSGGHVAIYSEPGHGTTVKIYLPRHLGSPEEAGLAAEGGLLPDAAGTEVVLVVEDEERVRQMSVDALRELGYIVYQASGGDEALRVLDTLARLDLLFTDVVMPGMTGRELAERVRARAPHVKVLYTTGYTRNAVVHNGVLDAGVDFLPKPFSIAALSSKVRSVLDRASVEHA